jgi:hypothetical protein
MQVNNEGAHVARATELGIGYQEGRSRPALGRSPKVAIEAGVVAEYLRVTGSTELDLTRFEVIEDIGPTDPAKFRDQDNALLSAEAGQLTGR